jgi:hypothetical protein
MLLPLDLELYGSKVAQFQNHGPHGVQNVMLMPMRDDQNADTLVAMLGSCSPHMTLEPGANYYLKDHGHDYHHLGRMLDGYTR